MQKREPLNKNNIEDIISLTPMQEGMLFNYLKNPESKQYYEQLIIEFSGNLVIENMIEAWRLSCQKHEMLRTIFRWEKLKKPIQIILKEKIIPVEIYDCSDKQQDNAEINHIIKNDYNKPIDLQTDPLRITICKSNKSCFLIISRHNIIYDGWSQGIIINDVLDYYERLCSNVSHVAEHSTPYKNYLIWNNNQIKEGAIKYWKLYLDDFNQKTELPFDHRMIHNKDNFQKHSLSFPSENLAKLDSFIKDHQITMATLIYFTWAVLLSKYNRNDDVLFGTIASGRTSDIPQIDKAVGLYTITLPLRIKLNPEKDSLSVMKDLNREIQDRNDYAYLPLHEIKKQYSIDLTSDLFNSIVIVENYPLNMMEGKQYGDLKIKSYQLFEMNHLDITIQVIPFDGVEIIFQYQADLFSEALIKRLSDHFLNIMLQILNDPNKRIFELEAATESEKKEILYSFNNQGSRIAPHQTIHNAFREQAKNNSDRIAVSFNGENITYGELDEKSDFIAYRLKNSDIKKDTVVAMLLPRSIDMVIYTMGILKAGAVCMPLDLQHPAYRINYILKNSEADLLICNKGNESLYEFTGQCIDIEEINNIEYKENIELENNEHVENAFLIYTSGSTGQPKGVKLHHKGIINHIMMKVEHIGITKDSIIGNNFSVNVVASIWQVLAPLLMGSKLVVLPDETDTDPFALFDFIENNNISIIQMIPSFLDTYLKFIDSNRVQLSSLQTIALTSEETKPHLAVNFYRNYQHIRLVNCYGQTECCDDTLHYEIPFDFKGHTVPIGKPSRNTRAYIIDEKSQIQPIGILGELCISGSGVTQGYWNNEEETKRKFIENPYEPGEVMYRTGDLAKWRDDGIVEYHGRVDHQIKLRGHRIELGEIETILMNNPQIQSAAAIIKGEESEKYIKVFYMAKSDLSTMYFRQYLSDKLPDYMIPYSYQKLESFPQTPNGKVDRRALAKIIDKKEKIQIKADSTTEKILIDIWKSLLHTETLDINAHFFEIGAHSLMLVQAADIIKEKCNIKFEIAKLFQYPSIRELAQYIDSDNESSVNEAKKTVVSDNNDIAVIGMAGRFPKAKDIYEFWENLKKGIDCITFFNDQEIEDSFYKHQNTGERVVKAWGVLDSIECFDPEFFGLSQREAEIMDPQQRIFLECVWETIENAGYVPREYEDKIGLFAGIGFNTYLYNNLLLREDILNSMGEFNIAIGNDKDFITTRSAYLLNLKGPSVTVQTACSTSLVAVHLACQSLIQEECSMAVAGGVSIKIPQKSGYVYQEGGNASYSGHCKAMNADADGAVFGNGAGSVLLKRYSQAVHDGDYIYAVIKATAVNNDGYSKVSFTAPSVSGQAHVINDALTKSNISIEDIDFVELHGSSTKLGDPVEIEALKEVFSARSSKKSFCALGSAKTNVGHLDVAAGITGFIKAVLSIQNQSIPPLLHYNLPNPNINFVDSPFYISNGFSCIDLNKKITACVSSFGIGGTNAHVILEEHKTTNHSEHKKSKYVIILSALSTSALGTIKANLYHYLLKNPNMSLDDIEYTLQVGRSSFEFREMILCENKEELLERLNSGVQIKDAKKKSCVFVFDNDCKEYVDFIIELYKTNHAFNRIINEIAPNEIKDKNDIYNKQDNGFNVIIQYALTLLFEEYGIRPAKVIGYGNGAITAAIVAGALKYQEGINLARGVLVKENIVFNPRIPISVNGSDNISLQDLKSCITNQASINDVMPTLKENDESFYLIFGKAKVSEGLSLAENETGIDYVLGYTWLHGINLNWQKARETCQCKRIPLPTYPFNKKECWVYPPANQSKKINNKTNIDDWFYNPVWKKSDLKYYDQEKSNQETKITLVFNDANNIVEHLSYNTKNQDNIYVVPGKSFLKKEKIKYEIGSLKIGDYDLLIKNVLADYKKIDQIIYCWNRPDIFKNNDKYNGIKSFLYMIKALKNSSNDHKIKIFIVSPNTYGVFASDKIAPEHSLLIGACKVVAQEHPNIACRVIDTDSFDAVFVQNHLKKEIQVKTTDVSVAYRQNMRWLQTYEKISLEDYYTSKFTICNDGVYVITGGTGRIGLHLAKAFAEKAQVNLILLSRTGLQNTRGNVREIIEKIKAQGSSVTVYAVDVTHYKSMLETIKVIKDTSGKINGIIHAAGITGLAGVKSIDELNDNDVCSQLEPKVQGALNIDKIVRLNMIELDFYILFSSLSSILGGLGSYCYSAANSFLDALAWSDSKTSCVKKMSINFDTWDFDDNNQWRTLKENSMTPEQGVDVFFKAIFSPFEQIAVSKSSLQRRIDQWITKRNNDTYKNARISTRTIDPNDMPKDSLMKLVASIWEEVLGISPIGVNDNFFELGGHSLTGIQVASRIREIFNIEISLRSLFESPFLSGLAGEIKDKFGNDESLTQIAEAYLKVAKLSDEEAKRLLDSKYNV